MRLIIGLEQRLRDLWVYREALDQGWLRRGGGDAFGWGRVPASVDKLFGEKFGNDPRVLHPYRTRMIAEQAERFSRDKLEQCRSAIVNAHVKLVSSREPPLVTLELLLVRMLS